MKSIVCLFFGLKIPYVRIFRIISISSFSYLNILLTFIIMLKIKLTDSREIVIYYGFCLKT